MSRALSDDEKAVFKLIAAAKTALSADEPTVEGISKAREHLDALTVAFMEYLAGSWAERQVLMEGIQG